MEVRVSASARQTIRRAAQLAGESLSSFMVTAAIEKAEEVNESSVTSVPADYFDRLVEAIDHAHPAPALAEAAARARRGSRIR